MAYRVWFRPIRGYDGCFYAYANKRRVGLIEKRPADHWVWDVDCQRFDPPIKFKHRGANSLADAKLALIAELNRQTNGLILLPVEPAAAQCGE